MVEFFLFYLAQLQNHVKALQQQEVQDNIRPSVGHQSAVTDTDFEANRLFLQSLSCEQVIYALTCAYINLIITFIRMLYFLILGVAFIKRDAS